jgi:hypothetical protein
VLCRQAEESAAREAEAAEATAMAAKEHAEANVAMAMAEKEQQRLAAEREEEERKIAQQREEVRLEKERVERERAAEAAAAAEAEARRATEEKKKQERRDKLKLPHTATDAACEEAEEWAKDPLAAAKKAAAKQREIEEAAAADGSAVSASFRFVLRACEARKQAGIPVTVERLVHNLLSCCFSCVLFSMEETHTLAAACLHTCSAPDENCSAAPQIPGGEGS